MFGEGGGGKDNNVCPISYIFQKYKYFFFKYSKDYYREKKRYKMKLLPLF